MTIMVKTRKLPFTSPVTFTVDQFSFVKETRTFVEEISSLNTEVKDSFSIYNPKTGNKRSFLYVGTDMTDGGEEIAGWRYVCVEDSSIKALVIND